jgi:hypothetical protein
MDRWWKVSLAAAALLLMPPSGTAATNKPDRLVFARNVCAAVERAAADHALDRNFFARLLWKESLFDPNAVSPKGAQGIAQFMPETAERRKLADPFEPMSAVAASASFLSDLKKQFGNEGLAAAAYNAGEDRISGWLAGKRSLPLETQDYVAFITGHAAEDWKNPAALHPVPLLGGKGSFAEQCVALASRQVSLKASGLRTARQQPWGVLLAADFNEGRALAMFKRLKLRFPGLLGAVDPMVARKRNLSRGSRRMALVMVGTRSQGLATDLCTRYAAQGLPCVVRKNR